MRKLKGGMRGSKFFDTRIYPVVRLATKAHLHSRCWITHKDYCFKTIKSLPWTQSRSPWSRFPQKSFTKKGGGLHVPRTKMSSPLHTKPEYRGRCRRATKTPRGRHTEYKRWFSPRTKAQGTQPCSLTHSRAKLVLNLRMWSICSLVGLEMFFNVSRVSLNSSKFQMTGGTHIYSPPSLVAVAPTVSKILRTIGWTDASGWGTIGSFGHS